MCESIVSHYILMKKTLDLVTEQNFQIQQY